MCWIYWESVKQIQQDFGSEFESGINNVRLVVAVPTKIEVASASYLHPQPTIVPLMKHFLKMVVALSFSTIFALNPASAAPQAKSYQVTGPVVEITDTCITVKKGEALWQIARDAGTKIKGDIKVGAKVTIQYRMLAIDVEVKPDKAAKPEPDKSKKN